MEKLLFLIIITQIITESLPISSSGHVALISILAKKFWLNQEFYPPNLVGSLFHVPALVAMAITFYKSWIPLFTKLFHTLTKLITKQKRTDSQQKLLFIFLKIFGLIFLADFATAIFYFLFKFLYKTSLVPQSPLLLLFGFCCTALILFSIFIKQIYFSGKVEELNLKKSLTLGVIQGLALIPGISRFASAYSAGLWLNLSPRRAFQISFLLHFPLIVADTLFHGLVPIFKNPERLSIFNKTFIFASFISTIVATLLLMLAYKLALKNKLWIFCFYMLFPIAILVFVLSR